MSLSAQKATQPTKRKDVLLGAIFVLAAVTTTVLLWPSSGVPADQQLRVFLIGWAVCALLLAGVVAAPASRSSTRAAQAVLWLGLGLVTGLGLGTIPWGGLGSGPVWQIWLTLVVAVGYLQQLQRRSRHTGRP